MLSGKGKMVAKKAKPEVDEDDGIMSFEEYRAKELEDDSELDEEDLQARFKYYVSAEKNRKEQAMKEEKAAAAGPIETDEEEVAVDDDDEPKLLSENALGRVRYSKKLLDDERIEKGLKWVGITAVGGGSAFVYQRVSVTPSSVTPSKGSPSKGSLSQAGVVASPKAAAQTAEKSKSAIKPPVKAVANALVAKAPAAAKLSAAKVAKKPAENLLVNPRVKKRALDEDSAAIAIRACVAQRLTALKDDFLHAVLAEQDEGIDMTGAPRKRVIAAVTDFLTTPDP